MGVPVVMVVLGVGTGAGDSIRPIARWPPPARAKGTTAPSSAEAGAGRSLFAALLLSNRNCW